MFTLLAKPTFSSFFTQFRAQPADGTACFKADSFHINSHDHRHASGQSDSDNPSLRVSSQVIQPWGKLAIKAHSINGAVNSQVNSIWVVGWWGTFWIAWLLRDKVNLRLLFFLHWNIINIYVFRHEVMIRVKYMDEC